MKIYLSADIEGIAGVTHWDETDLAKADYGPYREQMTAEVAAACEGALAAGATEIWVKDAHDSGRNLIADRLPREVRLIRGWSGHPFGMLQEMDETFQAVILIGYHSRAGANTSPLAHTMNGGVHLLTINGREASEFLVSAYTASYNHTPVVFVSGDQGLCDEITAINPEIGTVAVKRGVGDSTISIHPREAVEKIHAGVTQALRGDLAGRKLALPESFTVEIIYREHMKAYEKSFYPGAGLVGARTVRFESKDYFEVLRFLLFTLERLSPSAPARMAARKVKATMAMNLLPFGSSPMGREQKLPSLSLFL
jgi:D-amino peptidase